MHIRFSAFAAMLLLAACNFPTPTAEPPTETIEVAAVLPTDEPIEPPEATERPTFAPEATHEVPTAAPPRNVRIVYTNLGNLWAQELGSEPTLLVDTGDVSEVRISDDGEWIVYTIRNPDQDTAALPRQRPPAGSPVAGGRGAGARGREPRGGSRLRVRRRRPP